MEQAESAKKLSLPLMSDASDALSDEQGLFLLSSNSNMSNGAPVTGQLLINAFHAAHDFVIKNSTFIDVQGNYVRDHFVACVVHR